MTTTLLPAIDELERAFLEAVPLFGEDTYLPLPVITIQSRGRRQALGWFSGERWANGLEIELLRLPNYPAEHTLASVNGNFLAHVEMATKRYCVKLWNDGHQNERRARSNSPSKPNYFSDGLGDGLSSNRHTFLFMLLGSPLEPTT